MHRTRTLRMALWLVIGVASSPVRAAADEWAVPREAFVAALQAAQSGDLRERDSAALKSYLLHPYLQAARLRQRLRQAAGTETDSAIRAFLAEQGVAPVARDLRREWLQDLARRENWSAFREAYREETADQDQRCQFLLARIKTADPALNKDTALKVWMSGQMQASTCIPAFEWMQRQGWLGAAEREQRARLALEAGNAELAESLLAELPAEQVRPLLQQARLLRAPRQALDAVISAPQEKVEPAALLAGFTRLARRDSVQALQRYAPLLKTQGLSGTEAAAFANALANELAVDRRPEAMDYFRKVPDAAIDDKGREWRIRAAIWNGDWKQAAEWSRHLSKPMATLDRWHYWRARALEQQPETLSQAQDSYRALMQKNNLYAVLAARRLGQTHTPQPQPLHADAALQARLLQQPSIQRARELFLAHCVEWATEEWRVALQGASVAVQQQAGLLASGWGWHAQAIPTLAATAVYDDFDVTYPLAYQPLVRRAAERAALPAAWVYGVMRQESLYQAGAVSSANAYGLLQLLLPTARSVAKRWQQPTPSRDDLFDPQTNLNLGAAYLRDMMKRWNGSLVLALGSYNAGPGAVARWLPDQPRDADVWIENVPYGETRSYIQRILWHISVFGWRQTGQPQDLSPLLQPISKSAVP